MRRIKLFPWNKDEEHMSEALQKYIHIRHCGNTIDNKKHIDEASIQLLIQRNARYKVALEIIANTMSTPNAEAFRLKEVARVALK